MSLSIFVIRTRAPRQTPFKAPVPPRGTAENSPPFQRRGNASQKFKSPQGTAEDHPLPANHVINEFLFLIGRRRLLVLLISRQVCWPNSAFDRLRATFPGGLDYCCIGPIQFHSWIENFWRSL